MDSTRQHLLRVSDILGELESRLRSLRLPGPEGRALQAVQGRAARPRAVERGPALPRAAGRGEVSPGGRRGPSQRARRRARAASRARRPRSRPSGWPLTEELSELSAAKDELFSLSNRADLGAQRGQHYADEARGLSERSTAAAFEIEELGRPDRIGHAGARGPAVERDRARRGGVRSAAGLSGPRRQPRGAARPVARDAGPPRPDAPPSAVPPCSRVARLETEIEAAAARRDELGQRLAGGAEQDATLAAALADKEAELAAAQGRLSGLRDRDRELRGTPRGGRGPLGHAQAGSGPRRDRARYLAGGGPPPALAPGVVREIQTRYESFQRGVRAIMKQYRAPPARGRSRPGRDAGADGQTGKDAGQDRVGELRPWASEGAIRGLVADIVQPPPELETAVEAVLGDRLGNIIVESHEVGVDAIEFLKRRSEGRSSFIPLTLRTPAPPGTVLYDASGATGEAPATGGAAVPMAGPPVEAVWPDGNGVRGPMLELIGYDRSYHRVAVYLLGDVVVCEDLKTALRLWRQGQTDKTIVTLEGEVIDPHGVVTGGSRESAVAGILSQRREIRELEEVVARIESDLDASRGRQVTLKQALADAGNLLIEIGAVLRQDEVAVVGVDKDVERVRREQVELQGRRNRLAAERRRAGARPQPDRAAAGRGPGGARRPAADVARLRDARRRARARRPCRSPIGSTPWWPSWGRCGWLPPRPKSGGRTPGPRSSGWAANGRNTGRGGRVWRPPRARRPPAPTSCKRSRPASRSRPPSTGPRPRSAPACRPTGKRTPTSATPRSPAGRRSCVRPRERVSRLATELGSLQLRCQEASLRRSSLDEQVGRPLPGRAPRRGGVRLPPAASGGGPKKRRA